MGIHRQMARLIIEEAKYRPFHGSVLLIGRQTVHLSLPEFHDLLASHEMTAKVGTEFMTDRSTRGGVNKDRITDTSFFKALGADEVLALDISDYEGADILHNLNVPIPAELADRFDLIFNGSVLDNAFDPANGLKNISRMIAKSGRVIHFEHASNAINGAYLQFGPNWFFDYYLLNGYADCKTYLALFDDINGPWDYFACLHHERSEPSQLSSPRKAMTAVIAEKQEGATWDRSPIQGQYRGSEEWVEHLQRLGQFERSSRPVMARPKINASAARPSGPTMLKRRVRSFADLMRRQRGRLQLKRVTRLAIGLAAAKLPQSLEARGYKALGTFN